MEQEMLSITSVMIKDHLRILTELHKLEKIIQNKHPDLFGHLEQFKWSLEKHFFTEEKAIFASIQIEASQINALYTEIISQHQQILKELLRTYKYINDQEQISVFTLRELLIGHQQYEEDKIYPMLEKELSKGEKEQIVDRIQDIL